MSTERIYRATIAAVEKNLPNVADLKHLDIGSGTGELIKRLRERGIHADSSACDYTDHLMRLEGQHVDLVDLNADALPYADGTFDVITATEIIEHLENPRFFLREIARVLKPGGICVLSTPNVLNLNSRVRYLWFGFPELFGPLSMASRRIESCSGHITPISYFYLYHAMKACGFNDISLSIDKLQRSGMVKLFFLWLPIKIKDRLIKNKERRKYKTIDTTNTHIVDQINSCDILLARTIIVTASKTQNP